MFLEHLNQITELKLQFMDKITNNNFSFKII